MSLIPLEMVFGLLSERDYNFVQLQLKLLVKLSWLVDSSTWWNFMERIVVVANFYTWFSVFIIALQEKFAKQKANEARLEEDKKNLRMNLDDAENRVTRGELARRSLEGELQRLKLGLNDKETENQVLN